MWIRMGHFVRAWLKFFSRQQTDNWAAQAKAERGKGIAWTLPVRRVRLHLRRVRRDLGAAADRAAVGHPRRRLADPRRHHRAPDRLDVHQGHAALPRLQGMTRVATSRLPGDRHDPHPPAPARPRLAGVLSVVVAIAALSGCSAIDGLTGNDDPAERRRASPTAPQTPFDSQFTRDGTFQSHIDVERRGLRLHALPDQVDAADQRVVPEGRQVLLLHLPGLRPRPATLRDPFDTKRKVCLDRIKVTSDDQAVRRRRARAALRARRRRQERHLRPRAAVDQVRHADHLAQGRLRAAQPGDRARSPTTPSGST